MPTRVSYAGTANAGDVYTAANHARMPGGWIGYVEITASTASLGPAEADIPGLSVTVTAGSDRRLKISASVPIITPAAGTPSQPVVRIYEDGTQIGTAYTIGENSTNDLVGAAGWAQSTPSSGSHTYKLTVQDIDGSDTIQVTATSGSPAAILVEDMGPAT